MRGLGYRSTRSKTKPDRARDRGPRPALTLVSLLADRRVDQRPVREVGTAVVAVHVLRRGDDAVLRARVDERLLVEHDLLSLVVELLRLREARRGLRLGDQ